MMSLLYSIILYMTIIKEKGDSLPVKTLSAKFWSPQGKLVTFSRRKILIFKNMRRNYPSP